jgi:hypothetical protein
MATDDKKLRAELELLRALARQRRAEALKLARRRMMAVRRPVDAGAVAPLPAPAATAERVPLVRSL